MKKSYNILSYFCTRALFLGIGMSKILIMTKENFFISILLGTILGVIFLKINKVYIKTRKLNIFISSCFIVLGLIILINMLSTMYLTDMPKTLVGLPLILSLLYIQTKDKKALFRLSNILIILNLSLYIISIIALSKYIDPINFSYTNTSIKNIIIASIYYFLYSITPTLINKDFEYKDINITKSYIVSSITLGIIFYFNIGVLGPKLLSIYRYPEYIILKKVSLGESFENIENIISFMWIFDVYMLLLANTYRIKDTLTNKKYIYILLPILLLITTIINRYYILLLITYQYTPLILIILLVLTLLVNKHIKKAT